MKKPVEHRNNYDRPIKTEDLSSHRCPKNFKVGYEHRSGAKRHAKGLKRELGRITRVYQCPHCNYWHVTTIKRKD